MKRRRERGAIDFDESFALVLKDYHDFIARLDRIGPAEDPKEFAARHAAARGALAHLEHLMKLAGRDDGAASAARQAALDAARAEIGEAARAEIGEAARAEIGDAARAEIGDAARARIGDAARAGIGQTLNDGEDDDE